MATHSSILAQRIPWTEEPGGLQSVGLHLIEESDSTEATSYLHPPYSQRNKRDKPFDHSSFLTPDIFPAVGDRGATKAEPSHFMTWRDRDQNSGRLGLDEVIGQVPKQESATQKKKLQERASRLLGCLLSPGLLLDTVDTGKDWPGAVSWRSTGVTQGRKCNVKFWPEWRVLSYSLGHSLRNPEQSHQTGRAELSVESCYSSPSLANRGSQGSVWPSSNFSPSKTKSITLYRKTTKSRH